MNSFNEILLDLVKELDSLLKANLYSEYGNLQRGSKSLFQYAFDNGLLFMDSIIEDEYYNQIFCIDGTNEVFELTLIGLDYQVNQFTKECDGLTDQEQFYPREY